MIIELDDEEIKEGIRLFLDKKGYESDSCCIDIVPQHEGKYVIARISDI